MTDFDLSRLDDVPDPLGGAAPARPDGGPSIDVAALPPSPTRGRVHASRAVALAGALLFDAAWIAFVERRPDIGSLPAWSVALGLGLPLIAAAAALVAVMQPGPRGLGRRFVELAALVCAPPVFFAIGTVATMPAAAHTGPFVGPALRCIGVAGVLAAGPFAFGLLAIRRSFASAAAWRTAALGVACGGLAAATMSIVCPNSEPLHVVVAHGAMMLVYGLAGALAAGRVTRA